MYYCAYVGSFGEFACSPRTIRSNHLNHMVSLEGIVTKCSLVRPKVVKSVHYNERKTTWHFREYRDQTVSSNGATSSSVYPREDEDGNPVCINIQRLKHRLTDISSSPNTAIAYIGTIKQSPFKKCQSERLLVNYPEALMSS